MRHAELFTSTCLQGEDNEPRCFSTGAAIALAGIGKLPTTLAHRGIEIKLKLKTTSEPAQRLDRHAREALGEVARRIACWALDNVGPRCRAPTRCAR